MERIITVDVTVDGRKVGEATVTVTVPDELRQRYAINASSVLSAAAKPAQDAHTSWYCLGSVSLARKPQ